MKASAVLARWKAPPYPDAAWSSGDGTLIAVRFGDVELQSGDTAAFFQDVSEAYEASVPSLVWRAKDVVTVGSKTMLRHEFESGSSRGQLVNVVLSGSFDGRLFAITVTGPLEQADRTAAAATVLKDSLRVR